MSNYTIDYMIDCTGDVCVKDQIQFVESVFGGSFKKPKFLGERTIEARVIADSYGAMKQQHTFTLEITGSTGFQALQVGDKIKRKGRNIYRNGTKRAPWVDESARQAALDEKHGRGDFARAARQERKEGARDV